MEGSLEAVEVRLNNHEQRIDASHQSISLLRDSSARHETKISVITTELREVREDVGDIKRELREAREEQKAEMTWVRRGLWAAAGTFMLFFVAAASLLVSLGGG